MVNLEQIVSNIQNLNNTITVKNTDTKITKNIKSKQTDDFYKYLLYSLIFIFILSTSTSYYIYRGVSNIFDEVGLQAIKSVFTLFVLNIILSIFFLYFYLYTLSISGHKGHFGNIGKKGDDGLDVVCDICNENPTKLSKYNKQLITSIVGNHPEIKTPETDYHSKVFKWTKKKCGKSIIPYNNNDKKQTLKQYLFNPDIKYITGVIVGYNKDKDWIETMQFIYKDINNKLTQLGGKNGKWGKQSIDETNVTNLLCNENSGIYKIDALISEGNINAIQIYCRNINTGVVDLMVSNSVPPNIFEDNVSEKKFTSIECDKLQENNNSFSGFFSNISGLQTDTVGEERITNITIEQCNYHITSV